MLALTVQNFVSAALGMAVLIALIRGLARQSAQTLGNFWVDLTRGTLYILLPLAFVLALVLVAQCMPQTLSAYQTVPLVESVEYDNPKLDAAGQPVKDDKGNPLTEKARQKEQVLAVGPVASTERSGPHGRNSELAIDRPMIKGLLACFERRKPTTSQRTPRTAYPIEDATPRAAFRPRSVAGFYGVLDFVGWSCLQGNPVSRLVY